MTTTANVGVKDSLAQVMDKHSNPTEGLPTGFEQIDEALGGGLFPGDLVALRSMNKDKSTLGLQIVLNVAKRTAKQTKVAVYSCGDLRDKIQWRMLDLLAGTKVSCMRQLKDEKEKTKMAEQYMMASVALRQLPIYLSDGYGSDPWSVSDGISVRSMRTEIALAPSAHSPSFGLIFVDNVQLMRASETTIQLSLEDQLESIERCLKRLALEFRVPVLMTVGGPMKTVHADIAIMIDREMENKNEMQLQVQNTPRPRVIIATSEKPVAFQLDYSPESESFATHL